MAIIEPRLKEREGASRLALGFFNSLIRRIECTKPIDGNGIKCVQKGDGIQINLSDEEAATSNAVTINVCSSGQPYKLVVLIDPKRTAAANGA